MPDYRKMVEDLLLAPAKAYSAQSPQANFGGGWLGQALTAAHRAIDPVNALGGYGAVGAMALPPGMKSVGAGKTLYHGRQTPLETARPTGPGGYIGPGYYFSESPAVASEFANQGTMFNGARSEGGRVYPMKVQGDLVDSSVWHEAYALAKQKGLSDAKASVVATEALKKIGAVGARTPDGHSINVFDKANLKSIFE